MITFTQTDWSVDVDGALVIGRQRCLTVENAGPDGASRTEKIGNCRLMSAAPVLLQACKELCRRLEVNELVNRPNDPCNHFDQPAYEQALAAIARAEGGAA